MKVLSCWQLYVLMIPALVWLILFCYKPMYGVLIAFKDFKARDGIMASPWADPIWKYFDQFFSTSIAVTAIKNTIILSLEQLVINFPIPIIFALLLNQVKSNKARKFVQTVSYAPYFLSNVILVSVMNLLFGANGVVNALITGATGGSPVQFTSAAEYFRPMYIGSTVWQSMALTPSCTLPPWQASARLLRGGCGGRRHQAAAHLLHRHPADHAHRYPHAHFGHRPDHGPGL